MPSSSDRGSLVTTNLPSFNQENFALSFSEQKFPVSVLQQVHENGSICTNSGILTEDFDVDFNLTVANGNYKSIPSIPTPPDYQPTGHVTGRPPHESYPLSYSNDNPFLLAAEEQNVLNATNIPNGWEVATLSDLESLQQLPEFELSWSPDRCYEATRGLSRAYTTIPSTTNSTNHQTFQTMTGPSAEGPHIPTVSHMIFPKGLKCSQCGCHSVPVSNILNTNHNVLTTQADPIESFISPIVAHHQVLNRKSTITMGDSAVCVPTTSHQYWELEGEAPPGYSFVLVKKPQISTQPLHSQPQSQHYVIPPRASHSRNAENEMVCLHHDDLRALHGGANAVEGLAA